MKKYDKWEMEVRIDTAEAMTADYENIKQKAKNAFSVGRVITFIITLAIGIGASGIIGHFAPVTVQKTPVFINVEQVKKSNEERLRAIDEYRINNFNLNYELQQMELLKAEIAKKDAEINLQKALIKSRKEFLTMMEFQLKAGHKSIVH